MKLDTVPDWPQPQGIFQSGTTFNPLQFLATVQEMYEKVVIEKGNGDNLAMEYEAFSKLLQERTIVDADGHVLFKLFELEIPFSTPSELIVASHYLCLDCLRDDRPNLPLI